VDGSAVQASVHPACRRGGEFAFWTRKTAVFIREDVDVGSGSRAEHDGVADQQPEVRTVGAAPLERLAVRLGERFGRLRFEPRFPFELSLGECVRFDIVGVPDDLLCHVSSPP
jgi:hypothetical protein